MKLNIFSARLFFIILLSFSCMAVADTQNCIEKNINVCDIAKAYANRISAELPKTIGDITFTSIEANGKQIISTYNVNSDLKDISKFTKFTEEDVKENQKKMVYRIVCGNKNSSSLLDDLGLTIIYSFKFKDGSTNKIVVSSCKNQN